jgi:hypothetical protein
MSMSHDIPVPLRQFRELIHALRGHANQDSMQSELAAPGETRERLVGRAEAFVESAEIMERYLEERGD